MSDASPITADLFRSCMRRVAAPVGVISTRLGAARNAMTATAISSLSADPPQLLVCIHHMTRPAALIQEAGRFAINMLSLQHKDVARQCAISQLEPERRFDVGDWDEGETGMPVLRDAPVNFECVLTSVARHGTHFIFVGLVVAARFSNHPPLLYHDGSYSELGLHSGSLPTDWNSSVLGF